MGRYGYFSCFPRQMTKWEKAEKAAKAIARLTKKGVALSPIPEFSGRIAKTFWGKAENSGGNEIGAVYLIEYTL